MESISLRAEPANSVTARWCLAQYFADLDRLFEGGFDVALGNSVAAEEMSPPSGLFVVAWRGDEPVGCGVLLRLEDGIGEIKRMWVSEQVRGQGIAKQILHYLEEEARRWGLRAVRLDTNKALTLAQDMYRRAGYRAIGRYNDNPYAHHWFEKEL